jgi:hypothetical protein
LCHKKSPRNGIHAVSIADHRSYTSVCAVVEVGELVATKRKLLQQKAKLGYGPNFKQIVATLSKPLQL